MFLLSTRRIQLLELKWLWRVLMLQLQRQIIFATFSSFYNHSLSTSMSDLMSLCLLGKSLWYVLTCHLVPPVQRLKLFQIAITYLTHISTNYFFNMPWFIAFFCSCYLNPCSTHILLHNKLLLFLEVCIFVCLFVYFWSPFPCTNTSSLRSKWDFPPPSITECSSMS